MSKIHCILHGWQEAVGRDKRCPICKPERSWWQKIIWRFRRKKKIPTITKFTIPVIKRVWPKIDLFRDERREDK